MENEIRVSSWEELHERLYEDSWQVGLGRFRSDYAYRGMSRGAGGLTTSLMRLRGKFASVEHPMLRTFRRYAYEAVPDDSPWNWLALAQHHGLPTRLLDWSFSPYVALHFATATLDHFNEDGVIWCVNYVLTNQFLPEGLRAILDREGANVFTAELLSECAADLREFDRLADHPFVAFLEPPSLDQRIINQYALFSLMSSSTARLDEWLATHPEAYRKLLIPADLKWEIRDKLDQANITERVLFPGLDGLSLWLKRYYTPRSIDEER